MYRAYEGPNGWYVAREDARGYHHQPADGGHLSRAEAERLVRAKMRANEQRVQS